MFVYYLPKLCTHSQNGKLMGNILTASSALILTYATKYEYNGYEEYSLDITAINCRGVYSLCGTITKLVCNFFCRIVFL